VTSSTSIIPCLQKTTFAEACYSSYDWDMDDNAFECTNCGAKVYPDMTRCPECGHSLYLEDDESPEEVEEAKQPAWISGVGAVVIGWMIACGLALLIHFIVDSFQTPANLGSAGKVVLWLAGPVGAIVGSYVAAGIVPRQARWIGVVVAMLTLPVFVLFVTHWVEVTPALLVTPWMLACGVLIILAGGFGGLLNYKFSQDTGWKEKWKVRGWEDLLYQDLLRKVRFNGSTADRLIEYERQQDPQASRLKLIQSAIERWERDNR
jgi:zinc-ribbon domain